MLHTYEYPLTTGICFKSSYQRLFEYVAGTGVRVVKVFGNSIALAHCRHLISVLKKILY